MREKEKCAQLLCSGTTFDEGSAVQGRGQIKMLLPKLLKFFSAISHRISNTRIIRTADDQASATSYVYAGHHKLDGTHF